MRVTYLYDVPGWALHNLGLELDRQLSRLGVHFNCVFTDEWHANPTPAEVLYLSYSGLSAGIDYRQWGGTLLTTVHDPCEISRFEDRADWPRWPMIPVDFGIFDRVSSISAEMLGILHDAYGITAYRTPTWPLDGAGLIARATPGRVGRPVRVFSSTNVAEFFPASRIARRFRHIGQYVRDHQGNLSARQLAGLLVLRRRKNIRLLRRVADAFRGRSEVHCDFRYGGTGLVPREQYESDLLRSDIYVCTSSMEGGPLPVLEAVFAGLAVVSTPVGQVEEWVRPGENGWICRTLADFRRAIDSYARDPDILAAHRRRSLEIASAARFPTAAWMEFLTGKAS